MKDKIEIRYDLLIESVQKICKTKNIICDISSQTHWTFFKFTNSNKSCSKYEMNWMTFIKAGSNNLIIHEISQKIDELISAK